MADYGLKIFDAAGAVVLDTSERITRFRYSNVVAAGASGNTTLDDINGLSSVEFSIGAVADAVPRGCNHGVARSTNTISWTPQSGYPEIGHISMQSVVFVFLYT